MSTTKIARPKQRIIVTGAASGIGAAVAAKLHASGIEVVGLDRTAGGTEFPILQTDLSVRDSVLETVEQLDGEFTGLCNAAGVPGTVPWDAVLRINYLGLRDLTDGLVGKMQPGASIVNIASQAGYQVPQDSGLLAKVLGITDWGKAEEMLAADEQFMANPYGFSKHFVHGLTVQCSAEWQGLGIRSNSVSPGPVRTPIAADFRKQMGQENFDAAVNKVGRMGEPEDIAGVICFLLSDTAQWINGVDIAVDGGLSAVRRAEQQAMTAMASV